MILPTLALEKSLWQKGFLNIVGIDEVGRGSWAGPLIVAGVIFPQDFEIPENLADSKALKHTQRVKLANIIQNKGVGTYIVEISHRRIDKIGMGKATQEAFRKVARNIKPKPDFVLVDAFYIKHFSKKTQMAVKNGDKICASISAASIIAKVYRDRLMRKLHFTFPDYGFGKHKGYGTKLHQQAIKTHGFSKIHRMSFNLGYLIT